MEVYCLLRAQQRLCYNLTDTQVEQIVSHDAVGVIDRTSCVAIDKPLVNYIFWQCNEMMLIIMSL